MTRRVLLKPAQVAKQLEVSVRTLGNWRVQGRGPRFIKMGPGPKAPVRYDQADVDAEIEARVRSSTSDVTTEDRAAAATH